MPAIIPPAFCTAFKRTITHTVVSRMSLRNTSTMRNNGPGVRPPTVTTPMMLKLLTCVAILEKEKQRNLSRRPHKTSTPLPDVPGRNDHLASASEASVKARPFPASSTLAHVYSYHLTFLAQADRHSSNPHELQS